MANEPPCAILDKDRKILSYDYSRCNPMCCTTLCHNIEASKIPRIECPKCGHKFHPKGSM